MLAENMTEIKPSKTKRFFQFPVTRIFIGLAIVIGSILSVNIPMVLIGRLISDAEKPSPEWLMLMFVLMTIMAVLAYYLYVRWIEKRAWFELSRPGALRELGSGIMVGFGLMTGVILILWLSGYYQVTGVNGLSVIFLPLLECIFVGFFEEITFRGIIFRIMNKSLGSWLAIFFSSLIFGFAHAGNPNATLYSSIAITLEAGILLSAAYLYTRRLWIVIGMHFAWNFTLGGIFGVTVSGNESEGLLQAQLQGPDIFTGGAFGPELSIISVFLCLFAGIFFIWKAQERGNLTKPFWRKSPEFKSAE